MCRSVRIFHVYTTRIYSPSCPPVTVTLLLHKFAIPSNYNHTLQVLSANILPLSVFSLPSQLSNHTTLKPRIISHRTRTEYLNHTLFSPMAMKLRYYFSLLASISLPTVLIPVMTFLHDTPSSILDTSTPLSGERVSTP